MNIKPPEDELDLAAEEFEETYKAFEKAAKNLMAIMDSIDKQSHQELRAPGIDGYETYKRIIELHPGQKAIITSGFSETKRVKKAQKLGVGAYVKKPFLLEKIGVAVRDELDK